MSMQELDERVDSLLDTLQMKFEALQERLAAVEAERDAAQVRPEPISDKHKDGNWWLCWEPGWENWFKLRWRYERWQLACCDFIGTPTYAFPMPPAPEVPNA